MTSASWLHEIPESYRGLAQELALALAPDIVLEGVLGIGGMGAVLLGREAALQRPVAVKLLSPTLSGDVVAHARFVREAQAAAAVQHPHVVPIFRVGELPTSGTPYFVMQHIAGGTLETAFPEGVKVPVPDVQRIIAHVASALAAAHAKGLVHRDIKTANILLEDDSHRAIVVDFGISASRTDLPGDQRLTQQGQTLGTPRYMSPEVASGEPAVAASDVYSLGCVAYELLAGQPVFIAATPMGVIARHVRDTPQPLVQVRRDIPPELAALVECCLAKNPADRPSAQSLANALLPEELPFEWPPPGMRRVHGWMARSAPWFAVATLLFGTPILLAFGRGVDAALASAPGNLVFAIFMLLPVLVFFVGTGIATGPLFGALRVGHAVGLSSFTVLEVLADPGDGARLIAGVREFAQLTPAQRQRLRTLRIIRPLLLISTAPLSIVTLFVAWIALPRLGGAVSGFAWLGVAALVVPVLASLLLAIPAGAHVPRTSTRRAPLVERLPAETRRWREAVERVTGNDPRLRANPVPVPLRMAIEYGLGLAMVATMSVLVYLTIAMVMSATSQAGRLDYRVDRLEELRQWKQVPAAQRTPVDSTITETEAGRIAYRLFLPQARRYRALLPPADAWPSFAMLGDDSLRAAFGPSGTQGTWETIMARAGAMPFTPLQRALLERGAAHISGASFARLAHAPSMDLYAAVIGDPARVTRGLFSWTPGGIVEVAKTRYARAVLLAADGKPDSAAIALREVISVGALLMDDGRRQIDFRLGTSTVRRASGVLRVLLARTGNGSDFAAVSDGPATSDLLSASRRAGKSRDLDSAATFLRHVANGRDFLAHRFAALNGLRLAHCAAPIRALFPDDASDVAAYGAVERSLRRNSDRALLAWVRDTLGRPLASVQSVTDSKSTGLPPGSAGIFQVGQALGILGWSSRSGACMVVNGGASFW